MSKKSVPEVLENIKSLVLSTPNCFLPHLGHLSLSLCGYLILSNSINIKDVHQLQVFLLTQLKRFN